eukprot:TRINITY_DN113981_c0_g1_i1.p1 TRINITY_DN113981_c0_g1~~TRINITY_DN113981_c0_g1_i1.p1  ORF type:complete len:235 (+),score=46.05 TRINITY_DN113981_c0_g1_i1:93-797(+)
MAYEFHRSTMMPLTFNFKEKAKQSHISGGVLREAERSRGSVKRAREDSNRGGGIEQLRERARTALAAALMGHTSSPASDGAAAELTRLKTQLETSLEDSKVTLQVLQQLRRHSVDTADLRQTGLGRLVNDICKRYARKATNEEHKAVAAAAKSLVSAWRVGVDKERDKAKNAAENIERELWSCVATDEDVDDQETEYEDRLERLTDAFRRESSLRTQALAGDAAEDLIERVLTG